jgi:hypothetical protein
MVIRSEDEAVLLEVWNENMMTDALVRTCAHAVAEQTNKQQVDRTKAASHLRSFVPFKSCVVGNMLLV